MNTFELRLQLLEMSKNLLTEAFFSQRDLVQQQWSTDCDTARAKGIDPPPCPDMPDFPTEQEIISKATHLNSFVSNVLPDTKPNKIVIK